MKIKTLAKLHIISILLVGMFSTYNTPIINHYVAWSFLLWIFVYPLYYMLGKPGWGDL